MKDSISIDNQLHEMSTNPISLSLSKPFCAVCSTTITELIYAECKRCNRKFHITCLKKKASFDNCKSHFLEVKRRTET